MSISHSSLQPGKTHPTKADVYRMARADVHDEFHGGKGKPYSISTYDMKAFPTRLLVTRDPYSRLLSTYLDKIYLPDFWNWETKQIAQDLKWRRGSSYSHSFWEDYDFTSNEREEVEREDDFLRHHFEMIQSTPEFAYPIGRRHRTQDTGREQTCGKYLSFSQFISGIRYRPEPHWEPIHKLCNPCKLHVSHVSTMETFNEDARPVLAKLGLDDVLEDVSNGDQVDKEMTTIVDYNFKRVFHERESRVLKPCVSPRELAFRLWHNFRWRGYIDPDMDYVVPELSDEKDVREDLMIQLWRARTSGLQDQNKMARAKKEFRNRAFATLSETSFEIVTKAFDLDFKLFGYEEKREELRALFKSKTL